MKKERREGIVERETEGRKRKLKKERREGLVERETEGRKEKAEEGKKRGFSGERDRREERES
jgi:hypothetical protein